MKDIYVIDLFCGLGGFSTGARQAGAIISLAVDNWSDALCIHEMNHPETTHWNMDLGGDVVEFSNMVNDFIKTNIPDGNHIHLHASPPCQEFSSSNAKGDTGTGMKLVEWSLELHKTIKCDTWSLEEVVNPVIIDNISHLPHRVMRLNEYGVPSMRKRLFVGNIDWNQIEVSYKHMTPNESLRDICVRYGFTIPDGFVSQTCGSTNKHGYSHRSLNLISYTVTSCSPRLYNPESRKMKHLPLHILACIQTFPDGYLFGKFPKTRHMIANTVPPKIANVIISHIILNY